MPGEVTTAPPIASSRLKIVLAALPGGGMGADFNKSTWIAKREGGAVISDIDLLALDRKGFRRLIEAVVMPRSANDSGTLYVRVVSKGFDLKSAFDFADKVRARIEDELPGIYPKVEVMGGGDRESGTLQLSSNRTKGLCVWAQSEYGDNHVAVSLVAVIMPNDDFRTQPLTDTGTLQADSTLRTDDGKTLPITFVPPRGDTPQV